MIEPIKIRLEVDTAAAAESVKEFVTETQQALDKGLSTAVDRAKKKLEELARQQQVVNQTIEQEKRMIGELEKQRESARGEARKEIEEKIAGLNRAIDRHKVEIETLGLKKDKISEIAILQTTTSQQSAALIKAETDARAIELNILKDTQKAHANVGQEIESIIPIGRNFLTVMGGWAIWNGVISTCNELLSKLREDMQGIATAGEKLRGLASGRFEQERSFFSENGLRTAEDQKAGRAFIDEIGKEQGIERQNVIGAAATLAPVFKQVGIKYDSAQAKGLTGHAARFVDQGVEGQGLADLALEELHKNPNMTGEQFNQRASDLLATVGGSPSRLNLLLQSYQQNRAKYETAGFTLDDSAKMFGKLSKNTSPGEIPEMAGGFFRAVDRLMGLSPKEVAELHKKIADFGPINEKILNEQLPYLTPEKQIALQERMRRKDTAIPEMDKVFEDAAHNGGKINIKQALEIMGGLNQQKVARLGRDFAGPRNMVAVQRAAGFENVPMAAGAQQMPAPQAPEVAVQVQKEAADAFARQQNPPMPYEAGFQQSVENEAQHLDYNPEEKQWISHGAGFFWSGGGGFGLGYANTKEQAAARIYERQLLRIARKLQGIRQGKDKATPEQVAALEQSADSIKDRLGMNRWGTNAQERWDALTRLNGKGRNALGIEIPDGPQADDLLKEVDSQGENSWLVDNQNLSQMPSTVLDTRAGGKLIQESENALRGTPTTKPAATQPTTAPATQPRQTSMAPPTIINQNRIVNYGYGFDSIGSPWERDNRFS